MKRRVAGAVIATASFAAAFLGGCEPAVLASASVGERLPFLTSWRLLKVIHVVAVALTTPPH